MITFGSIPLVLSVVKNTTGATLPCYTLHSVLSHVLKGTLVYNIISSQSDCWALPFQQGRRSKLYLWKLSCLPRSNTRLRGVLIVLTSQNYMCTRCTDCTCLEITSTQTLHYTTLHLRPLKSPNYTCEGSGVAFHAATVA